MVLFVDRTQAAIVVLKARRMGTAANSEDVRPASCTGLNEERLGLECAHAHRRVVGAVGGRGVAGVGFIAEWCTEATCELRTMCETNRNGQERG